MAIQLHYLGDAVKYSGGGLYYFPIGPVIEGDIILHLASVYGEFCAESEIGLIPVSIYGESGLECSVSLPFISIFGIFDNEIDSDILISPISVYGYVNVDWVIGSIGIPIVDVKGLMQGECDIQISAVSIRGDVYSEGVASGDITIPVCSVLGNISEPSWISGIILAPPVSVFGTLSFSGVEIDGAFSIPAASISGSIVALGGYDFGSEEDVILKYNATRNLI